MAEKEYATHKARGALLKPFIVSEIVQERPIY